MPHQRQQLWQQIIAAVNDQYRALDRDEKAWLESILDDIAGLQQRLDELFSAAGGKELCRTCAGGCCHAGHNHITLVNLLQFVSRHQQLPSADFQQSCPFLGDCGCLLPVERRPYNCISFICDIIENALSPQQLRNFYRLEGALRQLYLAVAQRYMGAAMTGLLLQYQRQQGRSKFDAFAKSINFDG